jgi:hypothetical protein
MSIFVKMVDTVSIEEAGTPFDAMHNVALAEKEFG